MCQIIYPLPAKSENDKLWYFDFAVIYRFCYVKAVIYSGYVQGEADMQFLNLLQNFGTLMQLEFETQKAELH